MSDIVSDTVGPSEAGAWLSLEDAARFLRVTVRTLDRRGLPKRRLPGHPTEVWVAGADDSVSDVTETSDGHIGHDDERAIVLSERVSDVVGRQMVPLLAELAASRQRIEDLARENGLLTAQLATANECMATLTAPHPPVVASTAPEPSNLTTGAVNVLVARPGTVVAGRAGDRRRGGAVGDVAMKPGTRRAGRAMVRHMARLVVAMMYRLEEHVSDPAERWVLLKQTLTRIGRGTT